MGSGTAATAFEKVTGRAQSILSSPQTEHGNPATDLNQSLCRKVGIPALAMHQGFPVSTSAQHQENTERDPDPGRGSTQHQTQHRLTSILHPMA